MMKKRYGSLRALSALAVVAVPLSGLAQNPNALDPYLWLEEVDGERATAWVKEQNERTVGRLKSDKRFAPTKEHFKTLLENDDRLSSTAQYRGLIYEMNVTPDHPRGVLRRTSLENYTSKSPSWDNLLDLDALSEQDGKNWFFPLYGLAFSPSGERVILPLSDGGADEVVLREFDLTQKKFVENGFNTSASRDALRWLDENTLIISVAVDENERTVTGDSRVIRKWDRGTDIASAPVLLEVDPEHLVAVPTVIESANSRHVLLADIVSRTKGFLYALGADGEGITHLDVPGGFAFYAQTEYLGLHDHWVVTLESDWVVDETRFTAGSMISIRLNKMIEQDGNPSGSVSLIYSPPEGAALAYGGGAVATSDALYIHVMEHVTSRVIRAEPGKSGEWRFCDVDLPSDFGTASLPMSDPHTRNSLLDFQSLITPPSRYLVNRHGKLKQFQKVEDKIDASQFTSERHFALAEDGTQIPYFVIRSRTLKHDGNAPALLFGYGAFGVVFQPTYELPYIGPAHKTWLESGGVFVSTHGRGGGEYGPDWHQAAKRTNRQVAYDDIYAITEDLVERGVTSPGKIGFIGGSNGGLTSAVLATQRPDLFGAAISLVPITDMLRFHLLFGGKNWVDEYGDPEIPEERTALSAYSPYHNVNEDKSYPEIFLLTSTRDDRVHPGHARKMAAKMMDQGHPALFYEAPEGGHRMAIDNEGRSFNAALLLVFLQQRLMDDE